MTAKQDYAGVIGAGSFGTTVAYLLSKNKNVLIYSRQADVVDNINNKHIHLGVELSIKIKATQSLEEIASQCEVIFPVIPSENFRMTMRAVSPFIKPSHILIHATKGFDLTGLDIHNINKANISRSNIHTMSEVMRQETNTLRVGCMAGPNLSTEILAGQPTASVIASAYDEVIQVGQEYLASNRFFVFGAYDLIGAELSGALKNIIAVGSGVLAGKGLGKNIQAMLITRGIREMIALGIPMGATSRSFLGTSGIGDLIATATSEKSRNYSFGMRIGKGEKMDDIIQSMDEVVEGVRTLRIAHELGRHYHIRVPIVQMIYSVVFENYNLDKAINYLMRYPFGPDVDFI